MATKLLYNSYPESLLKIWQNENPIKQVRPPDGQEAFTNQL
jgi:hypothetical protein